MKMSIGKHTVIIQNTHYENHVRFETLSASCIWLQTSLGTMPRYSWACDQTTLLSLPTITEHALISLNSTRPILWRSTHLNYTFYTALIFSPKFHIKLSSIVKMRTLSSVKLLLLLDFWKQHFFFHWHSITINLSLLCTHTYLMAMLALFTLQKEMPWVSSSNEWPGMKRRLQKKRCRQKGEAGS